MKRHILVTGGAGYIGSHTCVQLLDQGYDVTIIDNLSNSSKTALSRIEQITQKKLQFIQGDITNIVFLRQLFNEYSFDAVIHFAGLKAVGESSETPLRYYETNVGGTNTLLQVMSEHRVKNIVFSSSATVYAESEKQPLSEEFPRQAVNPYGRTKLICEYILEDLYASDNEWRVALLRYFNPIGAHPSGLIGEDPQGIPNNLMPFISQVASGKRSQLTIFGDDYDTPDGTGVRDYIHVEDLAAGHLAALSHLENQKEGYLLAVNLGTGKGTSVLEMVNNFEAVTGQKIPYKISPRRLGDLALFFGDPSKANKLLNWRASKTVEDMCRDSWNWQSQNPNGYDEA